VIEGLRRVQVPAPDGGAPLSLELAVRDTGAGRWTLLCLHGFGDNLHTWQELRALLEPRGARVVALDLPGFGRSPLPREYASDYTLRAVLLTRAAAALWREKKNPLIAAGNSLGGALALAAAVEDAQGERSFDAQLLLAPATPDTRTPLFVHLLRLPVYRWSEDLKRHLSARGRRALATLIAKGAFKTVLARGTQPQREWWEATVESFARPGALVDVEAIARDVLWILGGQAPRVRELFCGVERISTPVAVLRGEEDRVVGAGEVAALARRIPGARLFALPGVGHCPQNEAPARCAEACLELLDAASSAGPG
jgi:pimeloyl-ACP methyl ester carboxylesterase